MAGFKKLNGEQPSVRRPFRISDLQDIWDGLGTIFAGVPEDVVKVVSGFELDDDNTVLEGTLIYNGRLFYYEGGSAMLGEQVCLYSVPSDLRMFADNQNRYFDYLNIVAPVGAYGNTFEVERVTLTTAFIADKLVGGRAVGFRKYLGVEESLPSAANPIYGGLEDSYLRVSGAFNPMASYTLAVRMRGGDVTDKVGKCVVDIVNNATAESEGLSATIVVAEYNAAGRLGQDFAFQLKIKTIPTTTRVTILTNEQTIVAISYEDVNTVL